MFVIHCGNGQQRIEWLGDTACHRYDAKYLWDVGPVQDIRLQNGVTVNLRGTICEELQDDVHVFVQLTEDILAQENADPNANRRRGGRR